MKPPERTQVLVKSGTWDSENSLPFEGWACFHVTISGNFKRFQYFNFETDLLGSENLYRGLEYCLFGCGHLGSRRVVCVWGCRVGAGAGAGVLSVAALFLWVFGFGLRAYCGVGLVCRVLLLVLPVGAGVLFGGAFSL